MLFLTLLPLLVKNIPLKYLFNGFVFLLNGHSMGILPFYRSVISAATLLTGDAVAPGAGDVFGGA
ncbi:MAG: hypothetical protein ACR5LG_05810 [Sodalis sp. (in: enterobacteria)]|uniref:hypothetical protein n=1 Tax=Sodalis sp. (in: enterobacteria) TaxID=1898979 RepID=UPI003F2C278E